MICNGHQSIPILSVLDSIQGEGEKIKEKGGYGGGSQLQMRGKGGEERRGSR